MFSVIIPSKTASNIVPCVRRILELDPGCKIIVIDDGIGRDAQDALAGVADVWPGVKPFVFARNVNLGIRWAGDSDVIVLNDDALLTEPHGFTKLHQIGLANPEYGIIASACNNVGNKRQLRGTPLTGIGGGGMEPGTNPPLGWGLRDEPRMVCLIAVWLRREMLNQVGPLDERYIGYGVDDDDLCFTARAAGWKIGIYDGCYVDHGSLRSSYRGDPKAPSDFRPNLRLFMQKWGHDNRGIPNEQSPWRHLLDEVTGVNEKR